MLTTPEGKRQNAEEEPPRAFLKCTIQPSVVSHEMGVFIQGINRKYESLIDADLIQANPPEDGQTDAGRVEIAIIQKDEERNALLVELPRQVVMGGRRIWVPESEVEYEHSVPKSDQKAP